MWASVLLLALRCIQGLAHGGESSTSATYVAEIAPKDKRGQWGSMLGIAMIGGSVLAFVVSASLTSLLGEQAIAEFGGRIPFLVGGVMALVVLWMRRQMHESDGFEELADSPTPPAVPRRTLVLTTLRLIAFTSGLTCVNYVWMTYMATYAITQQEMPKSHAYWATAAAQTVCLICMPLLGALSDSIGRKPMMFAFSVLAFCTTIPSCASWVQKHGLSPFQWACHFSSGRCANPPILHSRRKAFPPTFAAAESVSPSRCPWPSSEAAHRT